jgi:hypothetical protein
MGSRMKKVKSKLPGLARRNPPEEGKPKKKEESRPFIRISYKYLSQR